MRQISYLQGFAFLILSGYSIDSGLWGLAMSFCICAIVSLAIYLDP